MEELVKPGQHKNLMNMALLKLGSTTTAGTHMGILLASGATPLILTCGGKPARCRSVDKRSSAKKKQVGRLERATLDLSMSRLVDGLARPGQHKNLTNMSIKMWGIITSVGTQVLTVQESGASPLTQKCEEKVALCRPVPP